MSTSWKKDTLGNLITIKHGYAFLGRYFSESGSHVVLTPGNFFEGGGFRRRTAKDKWYSGPIPEEYVLKVGDLIIAMTEQGEGLLGSSAIIPCSNLYLHNQRLGLVVPKDESRVDTNFLYYLFNLKVIRQQIRGSASGTKVRHTSPSRIYDIVVSLPGMEQQRRIAATLSAYDALIETNERRIQLLEELGKRLFIQWFVHFNYPGHEKSKLVNSGTDIGMVPEGWQVLPISRLAYFINGYPFKPGDLGSQGLPIIKIPELRNGVLDKTPRNAGVGMPKKYFVQAGDLLFSWSATLLVNIWHSEPGILNQHLFKVVPKESDYRAYTYYSLQRLVEKLKHFVVGATMQHLRKDSVENALVLLPKVSLLKEYEMRAATILQQITCLSQQNHALRRMRDLLVPRLVEERVRTNPTYENS